MSPGFLWWGWTSAHMGNQCRRNQGFPEVSILIAVNVLPDIYDYWSLQETFHYFPIASCISRKRFLEIPRYLHFVDNTISLAQRGEPGYDRLGKIRPIIDAVNNAILTSYRPNCENSIDEAMIKFKGRSSLKQYVPLKPVKCGIKAWVRSDAKNGIMCELSVYTGKENDQPVTSLGSWRSWQEILQGTTTTFIATTILRWFHFLRSY